MRPVPWASAPLRQIDSAAGYLVGVTETSERNEAAGPAWIIGQAESAEAAVLTDSEELCEQMVSVPESVLDLRFLHDVQKTAAAPAALDRADGLDRAVYWMEMSGQWETTSPGSAVPGGTAEQPV